MVKGTFVPAGTTLEILAVQEHLTSDEALTRFIADQEEAPPHREPRERKPWEHNIVGDGGNI